MTRDELIQIAKKSGMGEGYIVALLVAYDEGAAAEREACAKACEEAHWSLDDRNEYAAAIRARGQE